MNNRHGCVCHKCLAPSPSISLTQQIYGLNLGVVLNCHHFHKRTLGVRGSRTAVHFFKNVVWCIAILRRGLKINIFKVIFWYGGRVRKKSTLCTLLIMLTFLNNTLIILMPLIAAVSLTTFAEHIHFDIKKIANLDTA